PGRGRQRARARRGVGDLGDRRAGRAGRGGRAAARAPDPRGARDPARGGCGGAADHDRRAGRIARSGRVARSGRGVGVLRRIDVVTIFPALFEPFLRESILGAAVAGGQVEVAVHDLRRFTTDRHQVVDDAPYGGGPGMVMKPEPLVAAIEALAGPKAPGRAAWVALLSPQGRRRGPKGFAELAEREEPVLVA